MGTKRKRKVFDHRATKRRKDRVMAEKKKKRDKKAEKERQEEMEAAMVVVRGPEVQHR